VSTAPAANYVAVPGDVEALRATVLALWQGNLGRQERLPAKYDWFYLHAPQGAPLLIALTHRATGQVIGVAAAGRRRMLYQGAPRVGGVLVDLAVQSAHRSLFPAVQLQRALMAHAAASFNVLYGFPNHKAAPVFARVGYRRLGELTRHAAVIRSAHYLGRRLPQRLARLAGACIDRSIAAALLLRAPLLVRCDWSSDPWDDIDAIWKNMRVPQAMVAVRDAEFVRWRCASGPDGPMRFYIARHRLTGRSLAWLACEQQDNSLHVRDWWTVDGGAGPVLTGLLRQLRRAARRLDCRSLSLEFAGAAGTVRALRAAGLRPRDSRPIYGTGFGALADKAGSIEWHLTSADEDE